MSTLQPLEPESREEGHMTYQEIADALGVSRGSVQRAEEDALVKCLTWCNRHQVRFRDMLDLLM